jgi:hypothetical protein
MGGNWAYNEEILGECVVINQEYEYSGSAGQSLCSVHVMRYNP